MIMSQSGGWGLFCGTIIIMVFTLLCIAYINKDHYCIVAATNIISVTTVASIANGKSHQVNKIAT